MNGWDAVCAYDAATLNAYFLQDWLARGPVLGSAPLQFVVPGTDGTSWLFDGMRGPVLLSFSAAAQAIEATIQIASGSLLAFDPATHAIHTVAEYEAVPGVPYAQVVLSLATAAGVVTENDVLLDLSGATVTATTNAMPSSSAGEELLAALTSYYEHATIRIPLGRLPGTAGAALQPTSFTVMVQAANDGSGDAAVVVLATTTGTAGESGPLPSYPIPAGSKSAVIVSCLAAVKALAAVLEQSFGQPFTFTEAPPMAFAESVVAGTMNVGEIHVAGSPGVEIWSVDANRNPVAIDVQYTAVLLLCRNDGNIELLLSVLPFDQAWMFGISGMESGSCRMMPNVLWVPATAVTSANVVTLSTTTGPTLSTSVDAGSANPADLQTYLNEMVPAAFNAQLESAVNALVGPAYATALDLSSLANVLTPAHLPFALQTASINFDLSAYGSTVPGVAMEPLQQSVGPGKTCTFSIFGGQIPTEWAVQGVGSIAPEGGNAVYTAPSDTNGLAVIEATISLAENVAAYGLAVVTPASTAPAFTIAPANVAVAAGCSYDFYVSDGAGDALSAACEVNPPLGTVVAGSNAGVWTYTAPTDVTATEPALTLTATSADGTQQATANVQPMTNDTLTIAPSTATVALGGTVTLTASSSNPSPGDYTWILADPASGSVIAGQGNSASATYTAPAALPSSGPTVTVYIYYTTGPLGLTTATVSLT